MMNLSSDHIRVTCKYIILISRKKSDIPFIIMKFFAIVAVSALLLLSVLPSDARPGCSERRSRAEIMDHHHSGNLNACQLCMYHYGCLCNCGHVCGTGGDDDDDVRAADDDKRCNSCLARYQCSACKRPCDDDDD